MGKMSRPVLAFLVLLAALASPGFAGEPKAGAGPAHAKGIYLLVPRGKDMEQLRKVIETPGVAGVSLSADWEEMEPEEGVFNWTALDAKIERAAQMGKLITLRIFPGISTPEWVYGKGARCFEFVDKNPFHGEEFYRRGHRHGTYGQTLKIPVPWDEAFLSSWEKFITAVGAHYKGTASIAMVHVTGPTRHSAEMHLPKTEVDKQKWLALGYTPRKLVRAWERCIDAFASAFPGSAVVLNLSPVIFDDEVMALTARYGYEKHGQRFWLQNNILLADNKNMMRQDWEIIKEYSRLTPIGFQRGLLRLKRQEGLSRRERLQLRRDNFEGMFNHGFSLGAKYFEVGFTDVRDFPEVAQKASERLKGGSGVHPDPLHRGEETTDVNGPDAR